MQPLPKTIPPLPPFLHGKRVELEPFTQVHLEDPAYLKWLNDLETTKHLGLPGYLMPVSFEELARYYQQNVSSKNDLFFAVIETEMQKFIGTLRIAHIDWISRVAEIGIMIGETSARGHGYASEMVQLAVNYAFNTLNLRKLIAGAHSGNLASLRSFTRLGFEQEGLFKEHYLIDGQYYDLVRLGLFQRNYRGLPSSDEPMNESTDL
jgi:ribosomal-protein-alanine N-acetyltransferase